MACNCIGWAWHTTVSSGAWRTTVWFGPGMWLYRLACLGLKCDFYCTGLACDCIVRGWRRLYRPGPGMQLYYPGPGVDWIVGTLSRLCVVFPSAADIRLYCMGLVFDVSSGTDVDCIIRVWCAIDRIVWRLSLEPGSAPFIWASGSQPQTVCDFIILNLDPPLDKNENKIQITWNNCSENHWTICLYTRSNNIIQYIKW